MNSFDSRAVLRVDGREYEIYRLDALEKLGFKIQPPALLACAFCWRTCCAVKTART